MIKLIIEMKDNQSELSTKRTVYRSSEILANSKKITMIDENGNEHQLKYVV